MRMHEDGVPARVLHKQGRHWHSDFLLWRRYKGIGKRRNYYRAHGFMLTWNGDWGIHLHGGEKGSVSAKSSEKVTHELKTEPCCSALFEGFKQFVTEASWELQVENLSLA